ncbi:hypothetical protein [Streptomyces virginiae]|uniref:Uncharacterized protein n=1 Tax=Streptomyces virginiae TaxID=1961 RepID=A0ABZ1TSL5_STRVG|nr:hypothetical protein [Streptomyces virginiae]MCX5174236.1 hypothetical protein [Streptomyces virginiae]
MTEQSTSRSISTLNHPHTRVVAAEIVVDDSVARVADFRGSFRTKTEQRIDALDTYCRACRRPYADVAKSSCAAAINNRHLIGGDQSIGAKRKMPTPPPAGAKLVAGGKFTRYGLKAYVCGACST